MDAYFCAHFHHRSDRPTPGSGSAGSRRRGNPGGHRIHTGILASDTHVIDDAIQKLLAQDEEMLVLASDLPALRAQQAITGIDTTRRLFGGHRPRRVRDCGKHLSPRGIHDRYSSWHGTLQSIRIVGNGRLGSKEILHAMRPRRSDYGGGVGPTGQRPSPPKIEKVLDEMHSIKEAMHAIGSLPEDIDAVFFLPPPSGPQI